MPTFPAGVPHQPQPALEAVAVHGKRREYHIQQKVVEERLEGRDRGAFTPEERREGAAARVGDGHRLAARG